MRALERYGNKDSTVLEAGASSLIVTYPEELLDEAMAKMARHKLGRLPVVHRRDPTRLLGYLGRAGIAAAWHELIEEEQMREPGWLTSRARLLRRNFCKRTG
jgi:CBS domain-containing protein